jgi:hypothetical protein
MDKKALEELGVFVDPQEVDNAVALLQAYVDAMMPVDLYSKEARDQAMLDATWAVMDIVIAETEKERAARKPL